MKWARARPPDRSRSRFPPHKSCGQALSRSRGADQFRRAGRRARTARTVVGHLHFEPEQPIVSRTGAREAELKIIAR